MGEESDWYTVVPIPLDGGGGGGGKRREEGRGTEREKKREKNGSEKERRAKCRDGLGGAGKGGLEAIFFDAFKTRSSSRIRIKKLTLEKTLSAALTDCER